MDGVLVANECIHFGFKAKNSGPFCARLIWKRPMAELIGDSWLICCIEWGLAPSGGGGFNSVRPRPNFPS